MIKKRCKKIHHENYDDRYEDFENRVFRLTSWVTAILGIWVAVVLGISVAQFKLSNDALNQLERADKNNELLANIALAATPNSKLDAISEAIDADPDNAKLYYYRAITNYSIALSSIDETQIYRRTFVANNQTLQNIYQDSNQLNFAYEDCEKAIQIDDDYADAYYLQGQIKFAQKDYKAAYQCFEKCSRYKRSLSVNIENGELYAYLGRTSFKLGNNEKCLEYLLKISEYQTIVLDRTVPSIYDTINYTIAEAYNNLSDFTNASIWFDRVLYSTYPDESSDICQRIIDVYEQLGNSEKKEYYISVKKYIDEHNGEKPQPYGINAIEN